MIRLALTLAACLFFMAPAANAAQDADVLVIEVAGSVEGIIEIELLVNLAPKHVAQIKKIARAGRYDRIVFHRVIDGFMAQTGDVEFGLHRGTEIGMAGRGGSELSNIQAEFSDTAYVEGIVGMARSNDPNSANSQFFIMFADAPFLNGNYTVVGRVISGIEVVHGIKKGDEDQNGLVHDPDYMKSVRIKSDIN